VIENVIGFGHVLRQPRSGSVLQLPGADLVVALSGADIAATARWHGNFMHGQGRRPAIDDG